MLIVTSKAVEIKVNDNDITINEVNDNAASIEKIYSDRKTAKIGIGVGDTGEPVAAVVVTDTKEIDDARKRIKRWGLSLEPFQDLSESKLSVVRNIVGQLRSDGVTACGKLSAGYRVSSAGVQKIEDDKKEIVNNLPPVTGIEKPLILIKKGCIEVCLQACSNQVNHQMQKCCLYIRENGHVCIDTEDTINISKIDILNAQDHTKLMKKLACFDISFTVDECKIAHERAKAYLENIKVTTSVAASLSIEELYEEVIAEAVRRAVTQEKNKEHDFISYSVDEKNSIVSIETSRFSKLLSEIGAGYSATVFCKRLIILAADKNEELILRQNSRPGFTMNTNGNKRYYKFPLVTSIVDGREYYHTSYESNGGSETDE